MSMRITVTGGTGMIGQRLIGELTGRGDDVTVLTRNPDRARAALGGRDQIEAAAWDPAAGPAPPSALRGRDAVIHLAGENIAQRWSDSAKRRIRESREQGTRNLVAGLRDAGEDRPRVLVSASGVDYYGAHGPEPLPEDTPPGDGFLPEVCVVWEREAQAAEELGMRVVRVRTGVVLDKSGGALGKMLPFFKAGIGGPVAGGEQYMPWIHADDLVRLYIAAVDDDRWSGPVNGSAEPVTNKAFSKALGRALHRPAFAPVPAFAIRTLYGEMAEIVTEGQNAVPSRALELGWAPRHPDVEEALRSALGD
jgi:uncharacterized protein (TIGR01777 family)